jgi:hypothetical protein
MIARHVHIQRPTVYGIGGLTILVHTSGTNHSYQDTIFEKVLMNYVQGIRSALARVVVPAEPWPSGDRRWKKVARCVPNNHHEL